jgi:rhodanese-related sulfurtransferase
MQHIINRRIDMAYMKEICISIECVDRDELMKRINGKSNFVLVDTIGRYDGNSSRIKGAKTVPYPEVIDRRSELKGYDEIIIYCRNKECRASKKAAMGLILQNIPNVRIYEGGIDEWTAENLPVEDYRRA